jgi:hypothetical protein
MLPTYGRRRPGTENSDTTATATRSLWVDHSVPSQRGSAEDFPRLRHRRLSTHQTAVFINREPEPAEHRRQLQSDRRQRQHLARLTSVPLLPMVAGVKPCAGDINTGRHPAGALGRVSLATTLIRGVGGTGAGDLVTSTPVGAPGFFQRPLTCPALLGGQITSAGGQFLACQPPGRGGRTISSRADDRWAKHQ